MMTYMGLHDVADLKPQLRNLYSQAAI